MTNGHRFDSGVSDADLFQQQTMQTGGKFESQKEQLIFAAMEMASEVGEVNNLLYKHIWQGHPFDTAKLVEEAGDVLWGIAVLLNAVNTSMSTCMSLNRVKLEQRYPKGVFTVEDSLARRDQHAPSVAPAPTSAFVHIAERGTGHWSSRRHRFGRTRPWEVFADYDDPALDYTRLNIAAPPYVRDANGDSPGPDWYNGNWRERAYRYQEAHGMLLPLRRSTTTPLWNP